MRGFLLTKNFPPNIGGMEQYCYNLHHYLNQHIKVDLVAFTRKRKIFLPVWGIIAFFQGLYYGFKSDFIWVGDASIAPLGRLIGRLTGCKIYLTVHALDITRNNKLYQSVIPFFVKRFDHIVCVSEYTKQECLSRGVKNNIISVIPNGINPDQIPKKLLDKDELFAKHHIENNEKPVLFTIGRHIERKGIHWFLEHVFKKIDDQFVYIIAGSGPYTSIYQQIIKKHDIQNVYLIGKISEVDKFSFYKCSDKFIMPNIEVEGDAEGFGIVCIEAAWCGLRTIASDLEGLKDAVIEGVSGNLIKPGSAANYIRNTSNSASKVGGGIKLVYSRWLIMGQYHSIIYTNDEKNNWFK